MNNAHLYVGLDVGLSHVLLRPVDALKLFDLRLGIFRFFNFILVRGSNFDRPFWLIPSGSVSGSVSWRSDGT